MEAVHAQVANGRRAPAPPDRTGSALDFAPGLLQAPVSDLPTLPDLLTDLARAFRAAGAGLAVTREGTPRVQQRVRADGQTPPALAWPWETCPELLAQVRNSPAAVPWAAPGETSWLLTAVGAPGEAGWLLWL